MQSTIKILAILLLVGLTLAAGVDLKSEDGSHAEVKQARLFGLFGGFGWGGYGYGYPYPYYGGYYGYPYGYGYGLWG